MSRTPGLVRLYRVHVAPVLAWVGGHFTVLAAGLFLLAVVFALVAHRRHGTRRRKLARTAHARNLAAKIGPKIGWKDDAERFITWPRDPKATGAPVVIRYPDNFPALDSQVAFIPQLLTNLVGGQWDPDHDHAHNRLRYLRRAPEPQLPTLVEYPDDKKQPIDRIPMAQNLHGQWIEADLTSESPHILVAGKTRTGKTSTMTVPVAHIAARGGLVDILDPKLVGYRDSFKGLPNVRVHTVIPEMIQTVEDFYLEMRARYEAMEAGTYAGGPTRLLVIDEMGTFMAMVKAKWNRTRQQGDPTEAPTVEQYRLILWQGGQADFHLVVGAQQANAAVLGGSDTRESFALRIGTGAPSKRGAPLLFGTDDLPKVDARVKGRGAICLEGDDVVAVQLAHLTPARARAIASRGLGRFSVGKSVGNAADVVSSPPETGGQVPLPDLATPYATVSLVKEPARAEPMAPRRRGRPSSQGLPPVRVDCRRCGREWDTAVAERQVVRCPTCRTGRRVPVGARNTSGATT